MRLNCEDGERETVPLCLFPQSHFVRQLPVKGSLLVRFTSLHDEPALEGEVDMSDSEWTEGL